MIKNNRIQIYLGNDEKNMLERIKYRLNTQNDSNTIRCLIRAYYIQFIMGKEVEKCKYL